MVLRVKENASPPRLVITTSSDRAVSSTVARRCRASEYVKTFIAVHSRIVVLRLRATCFTMPSRPVRRDVRAWSAAVRRRFGSARSAFPSSAAGPTVSQSAVAAPASGALPAHSMGAPAAISSLRHSTFPRPYFRPWSRGQSTTKSTITMARAKAQTSSSAQNANLFRPCGRNGVPAYRTTGRGARRPSWCHSAYSPPTRAHPRNPRSLLLSADPSADRSWTPSASSHGGPTSRTPDAAQELSETPRFCLDNSARPCYSSVLSVVSAVRGRR